MGNLLGGLLQNLIESLLGSGIEAAGDLGRYRLVRGVCLAMVLLGAAWVTIASAFWWTSSHLPGVVGIVQNVRSGGPVWLLAVPAVAVLTFVLALLPVPGRLTLAVYASTALFALTLLGLANMQGGGRSDIGNTALSCAIAAIILPLLCLMLAMSEPVPLDAPLARIAFVYWSRYRHLLALRAFGREHTMRVSGPAGAEHALTLDGFYDAEHPLTITSGAAFKMSREQSATYTLSVKMGSPADILAFRISYEQPGKKLRGRIVAGVSKARRTLALHFYFVPAPGAYLPPDFIARITPLVEAGRPFLKKNDFVLATPFGIRWTHKSYYRLTRKDAQLEPVVHWMRQLVSALEPVSPRPAPATAMAAYPQRAPYGRQP